MWTWFLHTHQRKQLKPELTIQCKTWQLYTHLMLSRFGGKFFSSPILINILLGKLWGVADYSHQGQPRGWCSIHLGCKHSLSLLDKLTLIIKLTAHLKAATHHNWLILYIHDWRFLGMPLWAFDTSWWYFLMFHWCFCSDQLPVAE